MHILLKSKRWSLFFNNQSFDLQNFIAVIRKFIIDIQNLISHPKIYRSSVGWRLHAQNPTRSGAQPSQDCHWLDARGKEILSFLSSCKIAWSGPILCMHHAQVTEEQECSPQVFLSAVQYLDRVLACLPIKRFVSFCELVSVPIFLAKQV